MYLQETKRIPRKLKKKLQKLDVGIIVSLGTLEWTAEQVKEFREVFIKESKQKVFMMPITENNKHVFNQL